MNTRILFLPAAILLFGLTLFASSCKSQTGATVDYSKAFLVDVRTPEEFAEGSAPGAVNIPLNEVEARLNEFKGKENIVVFCRSGNRSSQAMSILTENGIQNVSNGGTWEDVKRVIEHK